MIASLDPRAYTCALHDYHSPLPWSLHAHHVVPLAWTRAAAEPESRTVPLCPTGHDALHRALLATMTARSPLRIINARMQGLLDEAIEWAEQHRIEPVRLFELAASLTT